MEEEQTTTVSAGTTLDPKAKEFTPTNTNTNHIPIIPLAVTPPAKLSTSPTRSLLLTPVPLTTESALRRDLEPFGDVRAVQMEHLRHGIVTVHFYDLRHAEAAFTAIRTLHMHCASFFSHHPHLYYYTAVHPPPAGLIAGRAVWAHYVVPTPSAALPDAHNQGTLVVFKLSPDVSTQNLRRVFEPFGAIKELRDTPWKKKQRFVEFFDTRDAEMALKQMNGKEIHGKPVAIEFSRPGGNGRKKLLHSGPSSPPLNMNITPLLLYPPPPPPPFYHSHFITSSLNSSQPPQLRRKKSDRGGLKKVANSEPVELVGSRFGVGEWYSQSQGPPRRNLIRKHSGDTRAGSTKQRQQQQLSRSRHWKGKPEKKHEARFLIKEDEIVESSSRDSRTTLMIKNIPNKYSQKLLLNMLDKHCIHCNDQIGDSDEAQPRSSYDFVYLPIDFNNKCNVGYGFVNMTSPEAALRLYKALHLQHWERFNSKKICEVTYARVQGLEALKEHFKNSKFPCEMEHYYNLPVVFSPPRDGREVVTEPLPIVGNNKLLLLQGNMVNPIGDVTGSDGGDDGAGGGDGDVASSKSGGVGDEAS
ncbi:protein terminal ear1 homolog [Lotus japonicus]|uniref:protein terminal ear1 homolog n=1 Tax=Lotus japonicus TaxID=34305 RepID=UPI00258A9FF0|nr:protein terminal ear1 homolog [Lotus japonicus]